MPLIPVPDELGLVGGTGATAHLGERVSLEGKRRVGHNLHAQDRVTKLVIADRCQRGDLDIGGRQDVERLGSAVGK